MNQLMGFSLGPQAIQKLDGNPPCGISAYKFLHSKDLKFWLEEKTIKIDCLASFSAQENKGGVGDPLELLVKVNHAFVQNVHEPSERLVVENLRALGIADLKSGYEMTVERFTVQRKNRYIYCLASRLNEEAYRFWNNVEGYDAVIKIRDIPSFIQAIQQADYYGQRVLGGCAFFDWVEYVDMPPDLSLVDLTKYKFIKDKNAFQWQEEIRFSWPEGPEDSKPYLLHIPDLFEHIELVDIPESWV